ncbi:MAG: nucleotidyltransferase family protein [Bacteroidia bacterium]
MKLNYKDLIINNLACIKLALKAIDNCGVHTCFVVNNNTFEGIITDGDIRRALLNGVSIDASIDSVINRIPYVMKESDDPKIVERNMKNRGISIVPILDDKSQLIGMKRLYNEPSLEVYDNLVVIMAGGLGTRLLPLTEKIPKPMLKISGKPILEIIIEKFAEEGFKNIAVCVNYKSEIIQDYFKDGKEFGVTMSYIEENKRLGTAGALSLIQLSNHLPIIVTNGDILTKVNYSQMIQYHQCHNASVTVAVRDYNYQVPFGVVQHNDGLIRSIVEKPIQNFYVNSGIYVLEPSVIQYIPKNEYYDMTMLINTIVQKSQSVMSYLVREYWLDIGQKSEFKQAEIDYA